MFLTQLLSALVKQLFGTGHGYNSELVNNRHPSHGHGALRRAQVRNLTLQQLVAAAGALCETRSVATMCPRHKAISSKCIISALRVTAVLF